MLYLLDANVLIDASRDYYPLERVPEFWEWLVHQGAEGSVKLAVEIHDEIKDGKDALGEWARHAETKSALLLREEVDVALVRRVVEVGYAEDLTDDEVERLGRDPFLVAYALGESDERCVVTSEGSKPSKERANRRVPDVCDALGAKWLDPFGFYRELDFKTHWKESK